MGGMRNVLEWCEVIFKDVQAPIGPQQKYLNSFTRPDLSPFKDWTLFGMHMKMLEQMVSIKRIYFNILYIIN